MALCTGTDVTNYDCLLRDDLRGTGTGGLSEFDLEGVWLEMDFGFGDASSTYQIASISLRLLGLKLLDFESNLAAAGMAGGC